MTEQSRSRHLGFVMAAAASPTAGTDAIFTPEEARLIGRDAAAKAVESEAA